LRYVFDQLSTFSVENLVANLLSIQIDAAGSQQGSLVRAHARARQMECRKKTRFEPANEPVEAGFSLRILLFVFMMA